MWLIHEVAWFSALHRHGQNKLWNVQAITMGFLVEVCCPLCVHVTKNLVMIRGSVLVSSVFPAVLSVQPLQHIPGQAYAQLWGRSTPQYSQTCLWNFSKIPWHLAGKKGTQWLRAWLFQRMVLLDRGHWLVSKRQTIGLGKPGLNLVSPLTSYGLVTCSANSRVRRVTQ